MFFYSSLTVTYKENKNPTDIISIHDIIVQHGLDSFISIANNKNGKEVKYKLED